jgi:hypothetical protein
MHHQKHGIHGMIGSLDCSHFVWGNCPLAHHGQYQGKEGRPTIAVEALADYNLFAWHAVFGYSGTLNGFSIWESSFLLQSLCDGSFSELDFPFCIRGESFGQLWMLVDGIYPVLARFVQPISVPIGDSEALFSLWQESKQKDIEQFFGMFKKKFHFFNHPIPFSFMEEIIETFYCCVILHNMAVMERINLHEEHVENHLLYDCVEDQLEHGTTPESHVETLALQFVQSESQHVQEWLLEIQYLSALGINILDSTVQANTRRIEVLPTLERVAQVRWSHLYDVRHHKRLTKAITRELKSVMAFATTTLVPPEASPSFNFDVTLSMIFSSLAFLLAALFPIGRGVRPFAASSLPLVPSGLNRVTSSGSCPFFFFDRTHGFVWSALVMDRNLSESFKYSKEGL